MFERDNGDNVPYDLSEKVKQMMGGYGNPDDQIDLPGTNLIKRKQEEFKNASLGKVGADPDSEPELPF